MSRTIVPQGYKSVLGIYETQTAIGMIHTIFEEKLGNALNLRRVSAPLFVEPQSGLNDDLNGVERPVTFGIKETGTEAAVVHSLAKWKRMALHNYGFSAGEGIYTDMNAIRRDEEMDNLHSIYVDQWDWEKVIEKSDRTTEYLKDTVRKIVGAICDAQDELCLSFPALPHSLSRDVSFVTTQELEDMYPDYTPKQRENAYVKDHRTTFIMQIGGKLRSGDIHDGRAPDYDDWSLNGDIVVYYPLLDMAYELSSMGIRVNAESLASQLEERGCPERAELPFQRDLLNGNLPLTMGGGIGQSRMCMFFLRKAHIGEVQASIWPQETVDSFRAQGVCLL